MSVSINIKDDQYYPFKITPAPRQSLTRKWQRLTRLQKSIVYLLAVSVTILIVYKTTNQEPRLNATHHPRNIVKDQESQNMVQPPDDDVAKEDVAEKLVDTGDALEVNNDRVADAREVDGDKGNSDHDNDRPVVDYDKDPLPDRNEDDDGHDDDYKGPESSDALLFDGPTNERQTAVVNAFKHSWKAYKKHAWGKDQLKPISKSSHTWFDLGLTLIDSLDTMYIMGLTEEFKEAREWVKDSLSFDKGDVNLFETTIRVLGGLLSSYHLSNDKLFLDKAIDLGDRLMPAFQTKSGVPYSDVNIKTGIAHAPRWGPDSSTSEVTTIQLEFNDLSYVTRQSKYKEAVGRVRDHVHHQTKREGLIPIFINAQTGKLRDSATISVGARGDSYYEYLLKEWIQMGKKDAALHDDYVEAVNGIKKHLVRKSKPGGLTYIGELLSGRNFSPKMDHLVAFISGTLALGTHHGMPEDHLQLAKDLLVTFNEMYVKMPTGLSPEIAYFNTAENSNDDIIVKPADAHNLQRPETVESLYYLYWLTGDKKYQDWGWAIFQAFEKYSKVEEGGYCSLSSVKVTKPSCRDNMESFWLGETLKYFYLLFADKNLFPFDRWVINTEAHPLPIQSRS